jgi:hypothetical protein
MLKVVGLILRDMIYLHRQFVMMLVSLMACLPHHMYYFIYWLLRCFCFLLIALKLLRILIECVFSIYEFILLCKLRLLLILTITLC